MTFHAKVRDVLAAEGWNLKNTHEEEQYSRQIQPPESTLNLTKQKWPGKWESEYTQGEVPMPCNNVWASMY